jgi:cation:H+ antiporter
MREGGAVGTVHVLLFLAGLAILVTGAEGVVRGGSDVATRMGVRPIVVGMTVVSLGTSLPELAIGLSAVADGNGDLAVGNIVGTNLVNTLLVLGLAALLSPIGFERRTLRFDLPVAAVAALVLLLLARDGSLSSGDGLVLTAYGVAYLVAVIRSSRRGAGAEDGPQAVRVPRTGPAVVVLVAGLAAVVVGAELLVGGASSIARDLGMSDAVVGLTIVAIGTSAPELVTLVVSSLRGDRAIALGNLMGSNVFNIALVLGPTVLASPTTVPVPDEILRGDLLLMVGAALACLPAFWTRSVLSRAEGALFVCAYLAYLTMLLAGRG